LSATSVTWLAPILHLAAQRGRDTVGTQTRGFFAIEQNDGGDGEEPNRKLRGLAAVTVNS
jgi:hypothetical protein